jgi:tetratricopeptide (TPR) repeat protein
MANAQFWAKSLPGCGPVPPVPADGDKRKVTGNHTGEAMRLIVLFAAALAVVLSLVVPASAEMVEDCTQSQDPNQRISGCSAIIDSGKLQGKDLALVHYSRGLAYAARGDYERAIDDYDEALDLDPKNPDFFVARALAYSDRGRSRRALKDFGRALEADPNSVVAYNGRGNAYRRLHNPARAVKDFDSALRIDPKYAPAYNNRAWALYSWRRYDAALADADRALELSKDNVIVIDTRAHILAALKRSQEALAEFERAMRLGGKEQVKVYQKALEDEGDYEGPIDGVYSPQTKAAFEHCLKGKCQLMK